MLLERFVASSTTKLTTFAEFEKLPEQDSSRQELRHGEVVNVPPPKHGHHLIQRRLRRLLEAPAGLAGEVETELGFRPNADIEYRIADVAFVSKDRWERISADDYLEGAPELVVEVLSPSNTATEMLDKKQLCLENGAIEFWVVNPIHKQVEVTSREGRNAMYRAGQQIPLFFGGSIAVDAIFA
jgi:Uma2 family endonuclease